MRLAEMAYERDDTGCYLEPSKRVRAAAKAALMTCCPATGPVVEEEPEVVRPKETAPAGDEPRETEDGMDDTDMLEEGGEPNVEENATVRSSRRLPVVQGVVMDLDRELRIAHVHFQDTQTQFPVGTKLMAVVERQGQRYWLGPLTVYESFAGSAHVTAPHKLAWDDIQRGTPVVSTVQVANKPGSVRRMTHAAPVVPMAAARPTAATRDSVSSRRTNRTDPAPVISVRQPSAR